MKHLKFIILILGFFTKSFSQTQGCETLLMNGVFNTFSQSVGSYTSSDWHQHWCNGTVKQVTKNGQTSASLDIVVDEIPLGLSFSDAQQFQSIYKSIYCGTNSGSYKNLEKNDVILKVASPEILSAYTKCKELESGGLFVNLNIRPDDRKVFVIDAKYTKPWGTATGPKVKSISFVPNVINIKKGSLTEGIGMKTGVSYSMICERSTDIPITVMLETEVGVYVANLPSFITPPTDQEKIMSALPRGMIIGWYEPNKIPRGWVLCDGMNATPDLIDKFPMGTKTEIGAFGGSKSISTNFTARTGASSSSTAGPEPHTAMYPVSGNAGNPPHSPGTDHIHSVSGSTTGEHLPPYTKIVFIMKL